MNGDGEAPYVAPLHSSLAGALEGSDDDEQEEEEDDEEKVGSGLVAGMLEEESDSD